MRYCIQPRKLIIFLHRERECVTQMKGFEYEKLTYFGLNSPAKSHKCHSIWKIKNDWAKNSFNNICCHYDHHYCDYYYTKWMMNTFTLNSMGIWEGTMNKIYFILSLLFVSLNFSNDNGLQVTFYSGFIYCSYLLFQFVFFQKYFDSFHVKTSFY